METYSVGVVRGTKAKGWADTLFIFGKHSEVLERMFQHKGQVSDSGELKAEIIMEGYSDSSEAESAFTKQYGTYNNFEFQTLDLDNLPLAFTDEELEIARTAYQKALNIKGGRKELLTANNEGKLSDDNKPISLFTLECVYAEIVVGRSDLFPERDYNIPTEESVAFWEDLYETVMEHINSDTRKWGDVENRWKLTR